MRLPSGSRGAIAQLQLRRLGDIYEAATGRKSCYL
jgi:hypothetical protein